MIKLPFSFNLGLYLLLFSDWLVPSYNPQQIYGLQFGASQSEKNTKWSPILLILLAVNILYTILWIIIE